MGRSKYAIELELSTHDELDIDGKIKTETQNHFLFFFPLEQLDGYNFSCEGK